MDSGAEAAADSEAGPDSGAVNIDDDDSGCCWGIRLFLSAVADVLAPQSLASLCALYAEAA